MKKVLTKFIAFSAVGLLMLSACKKGGTEVVNSGSKSSTLTASATTLVLDKSRVNDTSAAIMFNVSAPSYNFKAVVKNYLQIDAAGDNWKNPTSALLGTKGGAQSYSTADFNSLLLKLNLPAGAASQVNVRVANELSSDVMTFSNVIALTVTPFNLESWVYVPGAYEGWSNPGAQEDSLLSPTDNGIYTGVINFTTGNNQFLVVPVKGSWANKWATTDAAVTSGTSATYSTEYVTGGGNNFYAPVAAGQYLVTLNTNTNQLTIVPVNYYSVIGDGAVDWNTDIPMKYLNDGSTTWTVTTALKKSGSIKIRENDDWTYSWGVPKPGTAGDGVANTLNDTQNNNISIPADGTYTVTFTIPLTVQAPGFTPSVLANYTLK